MLYSLLFDRKQVMYPFLTVDAVGEYDVDCGVIGGGTSGQCDKSKSDQW